jgi:hypothetical protein
VKNLVFFAIAAGVIAAIYFATKKTPKPEPVTPPTPNLPTLHSIMPQSSGPSVEEYYEAGR